MQPTCLDDAELSAFVEGRLEGEKLEAARAHVDTCDECQRLVAAYTGAFGNKTGEASADGEEESEPRYKLLGVLGTGAMGIVHHAHDSSLDRGVALKVLRKGLGIEEERLLREARAMAKLRHPNAVTVFDAGRLPSDGTAFIAMELVQGETLRTWLASPEPRPYTQVLRVFAQCARALAAAHALGIVHRDFKPDNVLVVTTKDPNGREDVQAKVVDFGLSHARGPAATSAGTEPRPSEEKDERHLTLDGTLIGTPAYMAPEQHDGREADAQSDQFAFFVTLFEALAKKRPFAGESRNQLRASIAKGVDSAALPEAIPERVRSLILKGLSEKPTRRNASMDDVARVLEEASTPAKRPIAGFVAVALAAAAIGGVIYLNGQRGDAAFAGLPVVQATPECRALGQSLARGISKDEETAVRDAFNLSKDPNATTAADHFIGMMRERMSTIELARLQTCGAGEATRGEVECLGLLHEDLRDILHYGARVHDRTGLEGAIIAARTLEPPAICRGALPDPAASSRRPDMTDAGGDAMSAPASSTKIRDEVITRMLYEFPLEVSPPVPNGDVPASKRGVLSQLRVLRVRVKEPNAFPDEGSWDDLERALDGLPGKFEQQRDEQRRAADIAAQKRLGGDAAAAAFALSAADASVLAKKNDAVLALASRAAAGAETLRLETPRAEVLLLRAEATTEEPPEDLVALVSRASNPRVTMALELHQARLAAQLHGQVRRMPSLEAALASDLASRAPIADLVTQRGELGRDQTKSEIDATVATAQAAWGNWHSRTAFAYVQLAEWLEARGLKPVAIEQATKAAEILRVTVTSPSRRLGTQSMYLARALTVLASFEDNADAREALFAEAENVAKGPYAGTIRARPLLAKARIALDRQPKDPRAAVRYATAAEAGAGALAVVMRAEARALLAEATWASGDRDAIAASGPLFARALESAPLLAPRDRSRLRLAAARRLASQKGVATDQDLARDLARQAANEALDSTEAEALLRSLGPGPTGAP